MITINQLKDDEAIFFLSLNSDQAKRKLKKRYEFKSRLLVLDILARYPSVVNVRGALLNTCLAAFKSTIEKVDLRNANVSSYWKATCLNGMRDIIVKEIKSLSNTISLDRQVNLKDCETSLLEIIPSTSTKPTLKVDIEEVEKALKEAGFDKDFDEKNIFSEYLKGKTYKMLSYEFPDYSKSKIFRIVKSYKDLIKSKLGYSKRK